MGTGLHISELEKQLQAGPPEKEEKKKNVRNFGLRGMGWVERITFACGKKLT